jgi:ribosomal protein S18 acetylase RimI-like enzyme
MAGCNFRIATCDDARDLGAMHVASWRETYAGILPQKLLASLSAEARAASWTKILQEPPSERSTVYLAEHAGAICGFGSCGAQRTESLKDLGYDGEVSAIYVLRELQKQGVGTRLFSQMSLDLSRRGCNAAALWVLRDNLTARRFYERYSGQVIAQRQDVRDGTVLIELAYGWPDLKELQRLIAHE